MPRSRSRGARLAVREARLITKELRHLGVPPQNIAKIWAVVIAVPVVLVIGYLSFNYDSGSDDPSILGGVQITYKDAYQSHVKNNTPIVLKSLTVTCSPGGDAQPVTHIAGLYPPLQPGYGEDTRIRQAGLRRRAELLYQQLDGLQALRRNLRPEFLAESQKHKAAKLLRQIPCIGPIRAARLLALMQTPHHGDYTSLRRASGYTAILGR